MLQRQSLEIGHTKSAKFVRLAGHLIPFGTFKNILITVLRVIFRLTVLRRGF